MSTSLKQMLAQAGVVFFILWLTVDAWGPFVPFSLPVYFATAAWIPLFFVAAILPDSESDDWGSIWPLSGYDNAIDAIYTRGPWLLRYDELQEQEIERDVADGFRSLFVEDAHN